MCVIVCNFVWLCVFVCLCVIVCYCVFVLGKKGVAAVSVCHQLCCFLLFLQTISLFTLFLHSLLLFHHLQILRIDCNIWVSIIRPKKSRQFWVVVSDLWFNAKKNIPSLWNHLLNERFACFCYDDTALHIRARWFSTFFENCQTEVKFFRLLR